MIKLDHSQLAVLVKRAQQGDESAFASLYAVTIEGQLYFATAFLKDASLAEDAVQEVYFALFKSLGKLENPHLLVAYLNRICYNTCVHFKKRSLKQKYELDEGNITDLQDEAVMHNPDNRYAVLEQSSEIYGALATLPDEDQAVFLMRYYHGMKIHEIAAALNYSESTAKRRIRAAIAKLKQILTVHYEQGEGV